MAYTNIDDSSAHFQTTTYAGDSSNSTVITNGGNSDLQPDFVWIKNRTLAGGGSSNHMLFNSSVGIGTGANSPYLITDNNGQETTNSNALQAVSSNGFTPGSMTRTNETNSNFVAWQWKANGGTTTSVSASGTGNGCINACTHQANTTAGFSIITYTGRDDQLNNGHESKLTHGLGVAPKVFICKRRDSADDWFYLGGDQATVRHGWYNAFLSLNDADAINGNHYVSNNEPDATHIFLGNEKVNIASATYVGYAFAEVQGYSKFGSYIGNGSGTSDGTFNGPMVYTGFKPAWVMVKSASASAGDEWVIWDNKRGTFNYNQNKLYANTTAAESGSVYDAVDFLSNGFKIRTGRAGGNTSGRTYIYMAFAEEPFVTSTGVPTTAR
jgi:hypothetical protein